MRDTNMRGVLTISLALVFAGRPYAAAAEPSAVKNPDAFVYAIIGDIDSLDPHWQYDGISHTVMWQVYDTLIAYKGPSVQEFEPLLSTVVPSKENSLLSQDGATYTFPIRKGVKFHDGTPLTAEDAKYSLMRFLLMDRAGGPSVLLLEPILGASSTRKPDGSLRGELYAEADRAVRVEGGALVVRLKRPFAPFLSILASFCPIVSKSWMISRGGWDGAESSWARYNNPPKEAATLFAQTNGTGPFMLDRWDQKEKKLVLTRNENYWRPPAGLKRLVFKTVDEFGARKLMLLGGDADAAFVERQFLPQVSDLAGVLVEDDLPLLEVHNAFVFNFNINLQANPYIGSGRLDGQGIPPDFFSDPDVRRGFAHAFDYEAYIQDGYRGKGRRARGPIPAQVPGHNPKQPVIAYDLDKAAQYLGKAWGGDLWKNGFRLSICFQQGRSDRQMAANILKKGIESLNPKFKLDVHGVQWSTLLSASVSRKIPLASARWALDYPDPHNCVHPFLHSEGYYAKLSGYKNPRADRTIELAAQEPDPDKRRALYRELQAIAYEDLPALFTVDTYHMRVRRANVQGWAYNPMMLYGYFYPVFKAEPS